MILDQRPQAPLPALRPEEKRIRPRPEPAPRRVARREGDAAVREGGFFFEVGAEAGAFQCQGEGAEGAGEEGEDFCDGGRGEEEGVEGVEDALVGGVSVWGGLGASRPGVGLGVWWQGALVGTYVGGVDVRPGDVRVEVDGGVRKREGEGEEAEALGAVAEGGEGEVGGGGGEVAEAVGGVEAGQDVVGEEGEDVGGGWFGVVVGDVGEGVVQGDEEGVVLGGGGVEELYDFVVVVDEGGEAGGVRAGFEDLVNGFVGVVVVVAVMAVVTVVVVVLVIVVGVQDVEFLLLLSGCYGTHESIPVQQSVPRVRGGGHVMLIGLSGRPQDNLIDVVRGSFWSHQGSSETRREDQESLHVDGTQWLGRGWTRKTNIQGRDQTVSLGGDRTPAEIFREHGKAMRRFHLKHAI